MATRQSNSLQLSRRLLGNYLMFGLLSIMTLAVGMLVIVRAAQSPASGPRLLTRLAESAGRMTADLAQHNGQGLQSLVDELSADSELQFCSVIGPDGVYVAHSNPALQGRRGSVSHAPGSLPGVIERVTLLREDQLNSREYWLPLRQNDQDFGMLQARILEQEDSPLITLIRQHFGTAVTVPLLLLLLGGSRLRGAVQSSSAIDQQLSAVAAADPESPLPLQIVEDCSPATNGWNRIVRLLENSHLLNHLESRLNQVFGGVQSQRYQQILQHLPDGVAVTDEAGNVTFVNHVFALLLDSTEQAMTGRVLENFLPQGDPENQFRFRRQCQELSRPAALELHRTCDLADGVLRLARAPFQSEESAGVMQLWLLRDITQLKLVDQTREQFVDTATHELRTPLANIRACAETLELDQSLDEETQKSYLNTIGAEATRLGRFVDEFLNISRMESGSVTLNRHATDLDRLVREAADKVRPQLDQKHIELDLQMPAKTPELVLDKDKISAALVNLLGNAAKYTPEGGKVSLHLEPGRAEMRIHVEDTGYGIAPEEVAKVFNKFFRSDDQRVRDTSGTGLGLSFAQEVTRLHGGRISLRSELNKGSRFTMTLPMTTSVS